MSSSIATQGSLALSQTGASGQLHLALAQLLPDASGLHHPSGSSRSFAKLQHCAHLAAERGADVVVFPEYFLSGATGKHWEAVRDAARDRDEAEDPNQPEQSEQQEQEQEQEQEDEEKRWLHLVQRIAKEAEIDIVAGSVVELAPSAPASQPNPTDEGDDGTDPIPHRLPTTGVRANQPLYNTTYYISRHGHVLHKYTKQNLWHPERTVLSASSAVNHAEQHAPATFLIETKRGQKLRAAMAICWDLAWYDRFAQMMRSESAEQHSDLDREGQVAGPDVIFVPTCWYASDGGAAALRWNLNAEAQLLRSLCATRALETESFVVMCNVAGPSLSPAEMDRVVHRLRSDPEAKVPLIGLGRSSVSAPFVGCVAEVEHEGESLLLQSVELDLLADAREVYRNRYDHAARAS